MTGDTIVRSRQRSGWHWLRLGLAALWVLWAATAWWTAPREAATERMRADFDSGRVVCDEYAA